MKTRLATLALAVFALAATRVLAQSSATFDFNNASQFANYFNSDGTPAWTYNATGGLGGTGGLTFAASTNDVWISKGGFAVEAGKNYTLSVFYKNEYNGGYGGMGFTSLTGSGNGNVPTYSAPFSAIGISAHGGGYIVNNNTSTAATDGSANWYSDAANNVLMGGNLPGNTSTPIWLNFTETISFISGTSFTVQLDVYNVDQTTGALGTLRAQTKTYTVTNADLAGATAVYPYFSTNGQRFTAADGLTITSNAAGVNLVDPSAAPVPEPSTYALLAGLAGLGLAVYRRRRRALATA